MSIIASLLLFSLALLARCQDDCNFECTDDYTPVCGTDGVTYGNLCLLELADCLSEEDITLAYEGECQKCDFECLDLWSPVCGTDNVTYSNLCELNRADCLSDADISLDYEGECQPPVHDIAAHCDQSMLDEDCSTHFYAPLCEISGTSYRTFCDLCQAELEAQASGENIIYVIDHLGPCQ
uniref:Kazal-type serine proteinase inhibitor 4 n=1 Tax=Procambarus clarkii TaxID=6728 RepID=D8VNK0_PROCL|nr:Kazal-type serine proteinase inhibitor 4 [Procambarus clarkii]